MVLGESLVLGLVLATILGKELGESLVLGLVLRAKLGSWLGCKLGS